MQNEKDDFHFFLHDVVGNVPLQRRDRVRCVVSETELKILSVTLIKSATESVGQNASNAPEIVHRRESNERDINGTGDDDNQTSETTAVRDAENSPTPSYGSIRNRKTYSSSPQNAKPISLFMHQGRVTNVLQTIGFMVPMNDLPSDYPQGESVRFTPKNVKSGGLQIKAGDVLEFILGAKDKSKPWAVSARLTAVSRRSEKEIEDLLKSILKKLFPSEENAQDISLEQQMSVEQSTIVNPVLNQSEITTNENETASERSQCLLDLMTCDVLWKIIGNYPSMKDKTVDNVIRILLHLEEHSANMKQILKNTFYTFSQTLMFSPQIGTLHHYIKNRVSSGQIDGLLQIRQFLLLMLHYVPERTHKFLNLIKLMVSKNKDSLDNFLFMAMKEIAKTACDDMDDLEWCDLPLVPSTRELTDGCLEFYTNLKPAVVRGPYSSSHEYLDTYFRLLRADCFGSLCKYLQEFLKGKLDHRNMSVYHDVKLAGVSLNENNSGLALMLQITPAHPVKNWAVSPKLMFGNLLCVSPTGTFKDPIWATVINRDVELLTKKQCIVVELCSSHNHSTDAEVVIQMSQRGGNMVMIESPTYYHAYKPVLQALQLMDPEKLPFQKELVEGKEDQENLPNYITAKRSQFAVEENVYNQDDFYKSISKTWPNSLDDSQLEGMKSTFTRRIVCIQGPPGTGKTFLGIHIVRSILSMDTCPRNPILVLTYKNHALDEFLKELLKHFPEHVVRVGGRCKEADLEKRNLTEIKKTARMNKALFDLYKDKSSEINQMRPVVEKAALDVNRNFSLTFDTFLSHLTKQQLIGLMIGMARGNKKYAEKNRKIINSLEESKEEMSAFFSENESAMKLFQVSINNWMPNENFLREEECKYRQSVSIHDLIRVSDATKSTDESKNVEDEFDEKDIEDMQKERVAAVSYTPLSSNGIIDFQTGNGSQYLRLLNYDVYRNQLELSAEFVLKSEDLWAMVPSDRIKLVQCLLLKQIAGLAQGFQDSLLQYQRLCLEKKELDDRHKAEILKSMKVVGMTITGASINADLLAAMKPSIVIVEEAAEVLEPQILAALGNWVEHLIMIGDHKQLRPQVENYKIAKDYHLDISMMERLINNKIPYCSLTIQNRMRPEIAALLLDIYPGLKNSEKVENNVPPSCIEKSMFFWDHTDPEVGGRSYNNILEAERAVRLALFLMQQGYTYERITILAAYQGQVATIRQQLRNEQQLHPNLFGNDSKITSKQDDEKKNKRKVLIQVHSIDMYQGDENDIVIVSLVRSNSKKALGFLKLLNRRCVAQSRAKCGLYFIGNSDLLMNSVHWNTLIQSLKEQNCFGTQFPLCCPKHPTSRLLPITGREITLQTFCEVVCGTKMPCGLHDCSKPCQPPHDHDKCQFRISFQFAKCQHPAVRKCYQQEDDIPCKYPCIEKMPCDKSHQCPENCRPNHSHVFCREMVDFFCQQCGNINMKMCSQSEIDIKCQWKVNFIKETCNHVCEKYCHESEASVVCQEVCLKPLPCGHPCKGKCGKECVTKACKVCKELKKIEDEKLKKLQEEKKMNMLKKIEQELDDLRKTDYKNKFFLTELIPEGDSAAEYLKVEDMVKKYIQPDHNWYPEVTKIFTVFNLKLSEAYLECRKSLFDPCTEELKFHGTTNDAIDAIIQEGFIMPKKQGMFGAGIYFATDSSKSAQGIYTKGSSKLLLCQVALGRCFTAEKASNKMSLQVLRQNKYDSLFAKRGTAATGGVKFDEFVVYQPDQALPKYIIHFTSTKTDTMLKQIALTPALTTFSKQTLTPKRNIDINDPLEMHYRIAESQFLRLARKARLQGMSQGLTFDIQSIDYYQNPDLIQKFLAQEIAMQNAGANRILAFHGTKVENVDGIMKNNFRLDHLSANSGDRGWYGAGIYFSENPGTSLGYGKALILSWVLPGKVYNCTQREDGIDLKDGYDSHGFGPDKKGYYEEIVIFNSDQILPTYVINYS